MKRLGLLLVLLAAGCGGSDDLGEPDISEPAAMMLRLSDLPEGFRYGDDRACGEVLTTEGNEPELDKFLLDTRPRACIGDFSREWGGEPRIVTTALFVFSSDGDARRAWEVRKPLLEEFARIHVTEEQGPGHGESVTFDSKGLLQPGTGEAWRDDRLLVAVYEEGLGGDDGRDFAAELAEKQRNRIQSPSDPREEYDREVGLEDPAIAIPVYWLGREFAPPGLPELTLFRGENLRGAGPGNEVKIDYDGPRTGLTLDLWSPEAWKRFRRTRLGQVARCAARTSMKVEGGQAEICRGRPNHWRAQVYYDDVVVAVNMPYCYDCAGRSADDPYNSREGMEAVVRGLRRR